MRRSAGSLSARLRRVGVRLAAFDRRCRLATVARWNARPARMSGGGARWSVAKRDAGGRDMKSIAFIGLGNMGLPMMANLIKAGYRVHAADVRSDPVEAAGAQGAVAARSAGEATGRAEVIVTMVPNSPEVETAYLGPGGVLEGARAGQIAIDMSTIDPATTRKVGARLTSAGVRMLDAPVSGGVPGAVAGTLTIMVGGDPGAFAEAHTILGT